SIDAGGAERSAITPPGSGAGSCAQVLLGGAAATRAATLEVETEARHPCPEQTLETCDSVMTPGESQHWREALRAREDRGPACILRHPAAMGRRWYSLDPPASSVFPDSGSTAQGS